MFHPARYHLVFQDTKITYFLQEHYQKQLMAHEIKGYFDGFPLHNVTRPRTLERFIKQKHKTKNAAN